MTDQPLPPSDKKPRRRSAPRKRAPAKRAPKAETAATPEVPLEVLDTGADIASSPEAVASRLDPVALADAGDRGDAPASDSPLANAEPGAKQARHERDRAAKREARELSSQAIRVETPAAPIEAERTDQVDSPTMQPPSEAPAESTSAPFPRQAELRPGELIRVPLSVRWRDLDAFNHVNNSKYLSYLEEARLRWMLAMPGMGMDENVAPVVAASNLNYRRPIAWPGDIVIELFVERIGGSSLTIGHRIVDSKDGGTLYCDGNVVMVWIDRNSGRSAPLPETVRAACR